jgi:hypothetical protein
MCVYLREREREREENLGLKDELWAVGRESWRGVWEAKKSKES